MSKKHKTVLVIVALVAVAAAIYFKVRKTMVYAKTDFPFENDGTKILKGTRLGELDKIEGGLVFVKANSYSIIPGGFVAGREGVDVELRKELA